MPYKAVAMRNSMFLKLEVVQNNFTKVSTLKPIQRFFLVYGIVLLIMLQNSVVMGSEGHPFSSPAVDHFFSEAAFLVGYGPGKTHTAHYQTALMILHLGINLDRFFPALNSYQGKLSFFIEPQFSPVFNSGDDYELGLGLGLQYLHPVHDKFSAYIRAGISPYYIAIEKIQRHQENGFLFSDLVGAGIYYHLTESSAISFGCWLRHLSNAGLEKPNDGINSVFGIIGYSFSFK